jgi:helix-turn-helix, Psq domain
LDREQALDEDFKGLLEGELGLRRAAEQYDVPRWTISGSVSAANAKGYTLATLAPVLEKFI